MVLHIKAKGDRPKHTPEEVKDHVVDAFEAFLSVALLAKDAVFDQLTASGVTFEPGGRISINPFGSRS
jgi:hypothetical protein